MYRISVAALAVVMALAVAPLPARAQGPGGGGTNNLQAKVEALTTRVAALETAVAALQAALPAETAARQAADTTLQSNITAEVNNRISAVAAEIAARQAADTTLQVQIDKLNGNITAADLEGTYNLYMLATALDGGPNTIASYVVTGTVTLGAGGTGQVQDTVAAGRQLTEQLPNLNWLVANVGGSGVFDGSFSWAYSNGTVTFGCPADCTVVTPAGNGQVMVGVQGGPPGNNQIMFVLTRQPF